MTGAFIPTGFIAAAFTPTLNRILLSLTSMVYEVYNSQTIQFK